MMYLDPLGYSKLEGLFVPLIELHLSMESVKIISLEPNTLVRLIPSSTLSVRALSQLIEAFQ